MDIRLEIERRIERERQKVVELRGQVDRSEAFIQGMQEALKMLPKAQSAVGLRATGSLRSGSDVLQAQQALQTTGRPLHISEILTAMGKEDTKNNRASLSSSLGRYARKGQMFVRNGPNIFSLLAEQPQGLNLPDDFGAEDQQKTA